MICKDCICSYCRGKNPALHCCVYDMCRWPDDEIGTCEYGLKAIAVADGVPACARHIKENQPEEVLCFGNDHDEENCPL